MLALQDLFLAIFLWNKGNRLKWKQKKEVETEEIEIEKGYSKTQTATKLRGLAKELENNEPFTIHLIGKKITVPVDAEIDFEYEEYGDEKELEIEIAWK